MKVLITNPPWPGEGFGARSDVRWPHKRSDKFIEYPIYLAYLVAIVRESGYQVAFLDAILEDLDIQQFARRVAKIKPDVVVLECSTPSDQLRSSVRRRHQEGAAVGPDGPGRLSPHRLPSRDHE